MAGAKPHIDIIYTKLYRPPLTENLVSRKHLLDQLESRHQQRMLMRVSTLRVEWT